MDDQSTQHNTAPLMDTMPMQHASAPIEAESSRMHPSHKKMWIRGAIIVAAVIVVLAVILYIAKRNSDAHPTPEQTLQSLNESSGPELKTQEEKGPALQALAKSSKPTAATQEDQLNMLNTLSQ